MSAPSGPWASGSSIRTRVLLLGGLLALGTVALFWRSTHHPFVNFDDDYYVTANAMVRRGLTMEGIRWAFTSTAVQNWHPLTWISHMADVQLFGLDAGKHHLVSVLLHAANAVLLLLVLVAATGAPWRSAFVAALFAAHPLHVESVAWVAERKDLLSTFFGLLALLAYVGYARRPGRRGLLAVGALLALSLLAKPMLVTLPFVLLLLDFWPLERLRPPEGGGGFAPATFGALVLEKVPLFALAVASSAVSFVAQLRGGAVAGLEALPFGARAANAVIAYADYLRDAVWPAGLAVYYPHAIATTPPWQVGGAAAFLGLVTVLCLWAGRRGRWWTVGWLWFVGTLVPVIGLVQIGGQARADRYTYFPLVGLLIAAVWGLDAALARHRRALAALAAAALAALVVVTTRQLAHWRSGEALARRALSVTTDNWMAHTNLGKALLRDGRTDEAVSEFREALRLHPGRAITLANLGSALGARGDVAEATALLEASVRADPLYQNGWYNLGFALLQQGRPREAAPALAEAARLEPMDPWPPYYVGLALFEQGQVEEAIGRYRASLAIWPGSPEANTALAVALAQQGRIDEALECFREAVRLDPANQTARQNLEAGIRERARR